MCSTLIVVLFRESLSIDFCYVFATFFLLYRRMRFPQESTNFGLLTDGPRAPLPVLLHFLPSVRCWRTCHIRNTNSITRSDSTEMRWGRLGGNHVCTEGLYRGNIKFPPEVAVTWKKRTKKGSKQPIQKGRMGGGLFTRGVQYLRVFWTTFFCLIVEFYCTIKQKT